MFISRPTGLAIATLSAFAVVAIMFAAPMVAEARFDLTYAHPPGDPRGWGTDELVAWIWSLDSLETHEKVEVAMAIRDAAILGPSIFSASWSIRSGGVDAAHIQAMMADAVKALKQTTAAFGERYVGEPDLDNEDYHRYFFFFFFFFFFFVALWMRNCE